MNNINCFEDLKSLKSIPLDTVFEFDGEEWKNIPYPFYADRYLVSDSGRSWSIKWHSFMRNHPNDKGYFGINLCKDGVFKRKSMSRTVALAFIEDTPENWQELDVNHKDENPANNTVDNLEWVTHEQNCNYGHHNERIAASNRGRKMTAEQRAKISELHKGKGVKAVVQMDRDGNTIAEYDSIKAAAEALNIDPGNISSACRGYRPSAGGFLFAYKVSLI